MIFAPTISMPRFTHGLYITRRTVKNLARTAFDQAVPDPANTRYDAMIKAPARPARKALRTGAMETVWVMVWDDMVRPGSFMLGLMHERWTAQTYLNGWPKMELHALKRFDDLAGATAARDTLALNKTFSQALALTTPQTLVTRNTQDLPFARPAHWHDASPRKAAPRIV